MKNVTLLPCFHGNFFFFLESQSFRIFFSWFACDAVQQVASTLCRMRVLWQGCYDFFLSHTTLADSSSHARSGLHLFLLHPGWTATITVYVWCHRWLRESQEGERRALSTCCHLATVEAFRQRILSFQSLQRLYNHSQEWSECTVPCGWWFW